MSFVSAPSANTVPADVGVKNPPMPAPPARIASAMEPCGISWISIWPSCAALTASGLEVKKEPMALRSCPLRSSRPPPSPGSPTLLEIMVRLPVLSSASAFNRCTGLPVMPKPPAMMTAPSGISAAACSTVSWETIFIDQLVSLDWLVEWMQDSERPQGATLRV